MNGKCQIAIGQAGVYRVASELILRGHAPYLPVADDHGVDILLPTGIRVQVKAVRLHTRKQKHRTGVTERTAYYLTLGWTAVGRTMKPIRRARKYSEECDYIVIFGIDEQRFWIVPSFVMDGRQCLVLGPKSWATKGQMEQLRLAGIPETQICKELGVCRTTVWNRKQQDLKKGGFVRAVRQCENRWEFLSTPPSIDMVLDEEVEQLEQLLKK